MNHVRQPNQYSSSATQMLMQYKRNAMAAHEDKDYFMRNKWCQKHDTLMLALIGDGA